jgi:enoyl-CoA hydratase/carnithine racemase
MSDVVRERPQPGIEVLRLDRPAQLNAMGTAMLAELVGALEQLALDGELRALVFSSTSSAALSAGADVGEQLDADAAVARMQAFTRLYAAVEAFPVATVAVCVGHCVGAGAELAAGCDVRVGGDNLRLRWPGAVHGVPVGPARLVPLVGLARAKELILSGRTIGCEEAAAIGFLQATAPAAEAEAVALELAAAIARHPPEGVRRLKTMFRVLEGTERRVGYENELLIEFQRTGLGLPRRG